MATKPSAILSQDHWVKGRESVEQLAWIERGAAFENAVDAARAHRALMRDLIKSEPEHRARADAFHTARREREKKRKEMSGEFGPRPRPRPAGGGGRQQAVPIDDPRLRYPLDRWTSATRQACLHFDGGSGFGELAQFAPVTTVQNGRVGWEDLAIVENNDTGQTIFSSFFLGWSTRLNRTGQYRYAFAATDAFVNVDFDLDGSWLTGTDSLIRVDHSTALMVFGQSGIRFIINRTEPYVYSEMWGRWGGQTIGGENRWFFVGDEGYFDAIAGELVLLALNLQIWTWADNGVARFSVADYWYPSVNPNNEVCVTLMEG